MTSKAPDVETYVAQAAPDRRAAMERLRRLCRRTLAGHAESIEYGMPAYKRGGKVEIAFASQKQYVSVYVMNQAILDEFRGSLKASSIGKGCIRFRNPAQIDYGVLERLPRGLARSKPASC